MVSGDAEAAKQYAYRRFLMSKPDGPDKDAAMASLEKTGLINAPDVIHPYEREGEQLGELIEFATLINSYADSVRFLDLLSAYLAAEHPFLLPGIVRHMKARIQEESEGKNLSE
jgi:hypothetical protein